MRIDRTRNTTRNTVWGIAEKLLALVLPFVARTILLHLLGEKYLGINSLFSSILQVLNMADLGIGTAIIYNMYKPIAEDNVNEICALLALYKKIYRIIGCIILFLGLLLMPFLHYFIEGEVPNDVNIRLVFSIYLINTTLSYFLFAYKRSLLYAFHRNDIGTKVSMILILMQYTLQIGVLFIIKNYYLYLIILPVITLLNNIIIDVITKKMYPQYVCRGDVSEAIKRGIKKQVSGIFIGKLCGTTRNSLDSIFISMFLGLTEVAIYSNYFYILNSVHSILGIIITSMMGGVGNSIVSETKKKNYEDFKKFTFLYSWLAGWCTCCMLSLYQHFMIIWVGQELIFPSHIMVLFCIYMYALSTIDIKNLYVTAAGLWWENKIRALLEFIVNFLFNYILGKYFGISGILIATLITVIVVNFVYGTYILFKYYFTEESLSKHYLRHAVYFIVILTVSVITYFINSLLPKTGLLFLLAKTGICMILPNWMFYIIYRRTEIFIDAKQVVISTMKQLPIVKLIMH